MTPAPYEIADDDAILPGHDSDAKEAAWSLGELERSADLESVRTAWSRTDGPGD